MALYYNGDYVSSINFTPQMTLAEYNALSVKPKYWIRTDAPESGTISAEDISYDKTGTDLSSVNVQSVITEINTKINDKTNLGNFKYYEYGNVTGVSNIYNAMKQVWLGLPSDGYYLVNFAFNGACNAIMYRYGNSRYGMALAIQYYYNQAFLMNVRDAQAATNNYVFTDLRDDVWENVGTLTTSNTVAINLYKEILIIPYCNGVIPYNSYIYPNNVLTGEFYISVYQSNTYNYCGRIYNNANTLSLEQKSITGWTSMSLKIMGKKKSP